MSEAAPGASRFLKDCLVDEEGATLRSPRRRGWSLAVSVTVQFVVLAAGVLVPLIATGERIQLPSRITFLPVPPPRGVPDDEPKPRNPGGPANHNRRPLPPHAFVEPPRVPTNVTAVNDAQDHSESSVPLEPGGGIRDGLDPSIWSNTPRSLPPLAPPPVQPKEPPSTIRVSEGVQQGKLIHRVDPVYPYGAKMIRLQGEVRLRALIGVDGNVREVEHLSGHPWLAAAAMQAVVQWRYQPTLLSGKPVEVETQITVIFVLRN